MLLFAFYIVKVIICSGILFGYYWLLLRNKIFHQYNRFYLLVSIVLSLLAPLLQINILHNPGTTASAIKLLQVVNNNNEYLDEIVLVAHKNNFTAEQVASLLYLLTSFVFLSLFIQVLVKIRTLLQHHRHTVLNNIYFVNTTAKGTPFSFLQYIFWNNNIDVTTTTGNQIFKHELAHVQQKHSYDKLFINAVLIFFWCNPFFWLVRKELNMIHEFMADKIAVEDSDTEAFAAMILQATYPQHNFPFTNPFFYSPIKRRLLMLTKNKKPKASYIGRVLVLPLAVLLFAAFTLKTKTIKNYAAPVYEGKKITVVIDAGHGGKDFGSISLDGNTTEKDLSLSIAKKIKSFNSNDNINIILTRDNDVYQTPTERTAFSKTQHADLFISIHIDATTNKDSSAYHTGMSVWVSKDTYAYIDKSKLFASAIIGEFDNNYKIPVIDLPCQRDRGIWVLQESNCPAVLIEAGFITNKKDIAYLQTEEAKETIAKNVLAAIGKYAVAKDKEAIIVNQSPNPNNQNLNSRKTDTLPTINLKNYDNALIIVDGEAMSNKELDKIKPENIHSINVLKDKSAIAAYGEKGKNGVVIIQTIKKELVFKVTPGKTKVDTILQNITFSGDTKIKVRDQQDTEKQPLYVVDGKIQNHINDINSLDPTEIESINVLKGENAFSKYGEAAKNGVVEIITKSNPAIKELHITEVPENKPLNEVVMVGYGTFESKSTQGTQDEPIFTVTENEPRFPGGQPAWVRYLEKNLNPNMPIEEDWKPGKYKITVSFIVRKDGSIADIKTNDYPGSKTSEHCIDLIRKGPKWEPAVQNGHIVNAYRKQPIIFLVEKK